MMASLQKVWKALEDAIYACTGLSPSAFFFTVVALALALYHAITFFFFTQSPSTRTRQDQMENTRPPPLHLGEITEEELKAYDGSDPNTPLLMAIKGHIYDVSQSRVFYGPGGPYASFTGKDASRALAKMSFEEKDLNGDISDLGPFELEALQDWEYKFMIKYVKVGTIKKTPVTDKPESDPSDRGDIGKSAEGGP